MKIANLILAAVLAITASGGFSASVTKKNYDDLNGNDDVVVDVDLSGISGGTDTNAVNGLIGEYDRTNLTDRIDRKRDKTDLAVYRKVKDIWTWTNWDTPDADRPAPADFLEVANSPGTMPIYYKGSRTRGNWFGANQYWPNGRIKYDQGYGPGGESATRLNFAFSAYDETGTNILYRFGASAIRASATNETLVSWDESSSNQYIRIATTDFVDGTVRRGVKAATNGLASVSYVDSATNGLRKVDGTARPLPRYLHSLRFDDSYPDDAAWYYRYVADPVGLCSARRVGNVLERNYDWLYDNASTFVIEMSEGPGRFASVGVASCGENISEDFANSGKWSRFYKCLPGRTVDGVNSRGVAINVNVVVTNGVAAWEHHVPGDGRDIDSQWAVRYVLDNAPNAEWAATNLANRVYISASTLKQGFSVHYAILDGDSTWLVEDGQAFRWNGRVALAVTNFRLTYGSSISQFKKNDPYGSGYERYAVLAGEGSSITQVWYTTAYRRGPDGNFPWPSEFAGEIGPDGQKIKCTEDEKLQAWANANIPVGAPEIFPRGVGTWQTVHTSIYDISNLTLRVAVQEKDDWYSFSVPASGNVKSVNGRTGDVVLDAADVKALPDNENELVENDNFRGAVKTVSPPVPVPGKWALSNVTNATGGAVSAKDVSALPLAKVDSESAESQIDAPYWTIYADNRKRLTIDYDYVSIRLQQNGQNWMEISPAFFGWSYTDGSGNTHRKSLYMDAVISKSDVLDHLIESMSNVPVDSGAVLGELRSNWLKKSDASDAYLTKNDASTTYSTKQYAQTEATNAFKCATNSVTVLRDAKSNGYITGGGEVWTEVNRQCYWMETGMQIKFNQVGDNLWYGDVIYLWYDYDNGWFNFSPDLHEPNPSHSTKVPPTVDEFSIQGHSDIHFVRHWISSAPTLKGTVAIAEDVAKKRDMTDFDVHGEGWSFEPLLPLITALDVSQFEFMVHMEDEWTPYSFEIKFRHKNAGSSWEILAESDETYPTVEAIHAATSFTIGGEGQIFFPQFNPWNGKKIYKGGVIDHIASSNWVVRTYVPVTRKINGQALDHDITIGGSAAGRYAMFIIPMNDTAYSPETGHYTQFELKASTNNFEGTYNNRCCFYSHSGHADGEYSTNDRMHLFLNHGGAVDQRSYVRIQNTLDGMPDYAPSEIVVIVDAALMNHDRSDGSWLYEGNEDVMWTWVRTKDSEREIDPGTNPEHCLWRPISPVRWFSKLPNWAR